MERDVDDTVVMCTKPIIGRAYTERNGFDQASIEKSPSSKTKQDGIQVSRHPLSTRNLDFAVLNPAFIAVKN
ncbi:hypothetical protein Tco_0880836, partial [Tanacetum coccineum]